MEKRISDIIKLLKESGITFSEYVLKQEEKDSGKNREILFNEMRRILAVMKDNVQNARKTPVYSVSGLTGGNAYLYSLRINRGACLAGEVIANAVAMALSVSEINASMGRIIACPTAGSCGIVPAAVLSVAQKYNKNEDNIISALFTAAGIGILIGEHATLSGAEGGCQAECGSAAAMAAAAVVEMNRGTPEMIFYAAAIAIKNVLGLVCDPVCGLVEIPCIKRNAMGVTNAIISADMALAGIKSYIPFDEVVETMYRIGKALPREMRETALGGLAVTPTASNLGKKLKTNHI